MGIHIGIEHRTTYRFDRAVEIHPHVLRLRPAPHCRTPILAYSLRVDAERALRELAAGPVRQLHGPARVPGARQVARHHRRPDRRSHGDQPVRLLRRGVGQGVPVRRTSRSSRSTSSRTCGRPARPGRCWRSGCRASGTSSDAVPIADFLVGLNQRLYDDIEYSIRMEPGRAGAGGDAHPRHRVVPRHRLAARRGAAAPGPRGPVRLGLPRAADVRPAVARAAPTARTPTSPICTPGPRCTCPAPGGSGSTRPRDCSPARVTSRSRARRTRRPRRRSPERTGVAEVEFGFSNTVHRVREDPRVTLPYTPEQWARIDQLGEDIDERLDAGDVRLTMGGEPTFVSIDDMEGAEWNTAADGEAKRALAARARHAPARPVRDRRSDPARPGQVVSRRAACRAGRSASCGGATASRCGSAPTCWRRRRSRAMRPSTTRGEFAVGLAARFGLEPDIVRRRPRGSGRPGLA